MLDSLKTRGFEVVSDSHRKHPNTAIEFGTYEYEKDKMGNFKSKYPDEMNHSIDATRYSRENDMKVNTITFGYRNIL